MKKIIKLVIAVFLFLIAIIAIISLTSERVKEAREQGYEADHQSAQEVKKYAILSGKDHETGEVLVLEINVWQEAGSGGIENVSIGSVPHGARVEVLESKEVEGNTFYKIRSSVGKISVLPTDFNLRGRKMKELPESEWTVPADETFPLEGWVADSFIIKEVVK